MRFADIKTFPGYEDLERVLCAAYLQAAAGKGAERHADSKPFAEQPMQTIAQSYGSVDGMMFQASKKLGESRGLPNGRAQAEVLGAIVYSAGVHIAYDTWAKRGTPVETIKGSGVCDSGHIKGPTYSGSMTMQAGVLGAFADPAFLKGHIEKMNPGMRLDAEGQAQHDTRDDGWIEWNGGDCPVGPDVVVEYVSRDGATYRCHAKILRWNWIGAGGDIIKYRVVAQADPNGWIKWNGGDCPVGPDVRVESVTRGGYQFTRRAGDVWWNHLDVLSDIIKYRVAK
jgi:hypothetical protein